MAGRPITGSTWRTCPPEQRSDTALRRSLSEIGANFAALDPGFVCSLPAFDVALPNVHGPYR